MGERWSSKLCRTCKGKGTIPVELGTPMSEKACPNPSCEMGVIYTGDACLHPEYIREWSAQVDDFNEEARRYGY